MVFSKAAGVGKESDKAAQVLKSFIGMYNTVRRNLYRPLKIQGC